jgi:hypothetical protein
LVLSRVAGGGSTPAASIPAANTVVIGGTPINTPPPATTTRTGTPVISNLVLNPTNANANDRITFSLSFTDANADVITFGIQFNGENKYYSYDVSGVASGNLAFNLTVQDTIGNVSPGVYQVSVFLIDRLGNVSNYLTATLTVQGSIPTPTVNVIGTWSGTYSSSTGMGNGTIAMTFNADGTLSGHNAGTTSGDFTGVWVQSSDTVNGTAGQGQFTARISGNNMTGSMTFGSQNATMSLTKQ